MTLQDNTESIELKLPLVDSSSSFSILISVSSKNLYANLSNAQFMVDNIPNAIKNAKDKNKQFCDVLIPAIFSKRCWDYNNNLIWEMCSYHDKLKNNDWYKQVIMYGTNRYFYIKENWFIDQLITKIRNQNYKVELVWLGSWYKLRIAWCEDNRHINRIRFPER